MEFKFARDIASRLFASKPPSRRRSDDAVDCWDDDERQRMAKRLSFLDGASSGRIGDPADTAPMFPLPAGADSIATDPFRR